MNRKGFTLVEILVSIALIGMIAVAFLPLMSFAYRYLFDAKRYTYDTFLIQQDVEQEMEIARNTVVNYVANSADVDRFNVFSKTIDVHVVNKEIKSDSSSTHGEIFAYVPENKIVYNVPELGNVSITAYRNNTLISNPSFLFPVDSSVTFKGTEPSIIEYADEHLMNVYRWYMSPQMTYGDTIAPSNFRDWIIVKEWNEARTPISYANSENLTFIPNIENKYAELSLSELEFLDPEAPADMIAERFAGRYFAYSVTPYSLIGRLGEEKFSNPISTNRIDSVLSPFIDNAVTVPVEWVSVTVYDIADDYSTVDVRMINGVTKTVNVVWEKTEIPINSLEQENIVISGKIMGYFEGVTLTVDVVDNVNNTPSITTIEGSDIVNAPNSGSVTYTYAAYIYDSYNNLLSDEEVEWSLEGEGAGLDINSVTGVLTINSSASNGSFTIVATSKTNPSIKGELAVSVSSLGQVNDGNSSVSIMDFSSPRRCQFTATVRDVAGRNIIGLGMNDFRVSRISSKNAQYETLTLINNRSDYEVTGFTYNGNGTYTWVIRNTSTGGKITRDDVQVQARNPQASTNYITIQTNLDGVRLRDKN